jgi:flagellar basal-body rod protein FlgC
MNGVLATAVSGLTASSMWMDAIASNIANARDEGPTPPTPPSRPIAPSSNSTPALYQPVTGAFTSVANGNGGVAANIVTQLPSYNIVYDPSAPSANVQGLVAMPNVDLATQFVDQLMATTAYRANIAVVKMADKMMQATLDMIA